MLGLLHLELSARGRTLRLGALGLRVTGPLAEIEWPGGACDLEGEAGSDDVQVSSATVDAGGAAGVLVAQSSAWRAERHGERLALSVYREGDAQLAARLWLGEDAAQLDYVASSARGPAPAWFNPLTQLAVAYYGLARGALLLHGAAVEVDGAAWLFCGTSGVGKSTLASRLVGRGHRLLSHDRTLVFVDERRAVATPFGGERRLAVGPHEAPLGAIFLLAQGLENRGERLGAAAATSRLAAVTLGLQWDATRLAAALALAERLARNTPCFAAHLANDTSAVELVLQLGRAIGPEGAR